MTVKGIDVSAFQGRPDWNQVKRAGYEFAMIKSSEGVGYSDPSFVYNWQAAKVAGLVRGAYHYARPGLGNSPDKEAEFMFQHVSLEEGDLLALDMEDTHAAGQQLTWSLLFLSTLESLAGFKPWFYSGVWYMAPHGLLGNSKLSQYGLWLSDYTGRTPAVPKSWPFIACLQYTSSGNVPGINGHVDMNSFNGSIDNLKAYGKHGNQPVKHPAPVPSKPRSPMASQPQGGKIYIVKKGDSLSKVFGSRWEQVYQRNKKLIGPNPNLIKPGQRLVVPF